MLNRIRLPMYLSRAQFPIERNVFRKADGSSKVLSVIVKSTHEGKTDYIPKEWHQKLAIALSHDNVTVEGDQLTTDVVLNSEYAIDWIDFRDYPIGQAGFTVESTPFNATNSNCVTCEDLSQATLVDDTYTDPIDEGETAIYPDVTDNDTIECSPYTLSLTSWNTTYLDSAVITQAGELTVVAKNPIPSGTNVLVATYRVTCLDGTYDEANVYADFEGSSVGCNCPTNLQFVDVGDDIATATWDAAIPAPSGGYTWNLYDASNTAVPLQTGTTTDLFVTITGLVEDFTYLLTVQGNCEGDGLSVCTAQSEFTTTGDNDTCGEFSVMYIDDEILNIGSYSYMDCNAVIQTADIRSGVTPQTVCMMLAPGTTDPYYFQASHPGITATYIGLCP